MLISAYTLNGKISRISQPLPTALIIDNKCLKINLEQLLHKIEKKRNEMHHTFINLRKN